MKFLLVALIFLATFCFSQQPAEVPVDQEPHHHLVFENEYVRVFKVEVAPHEATLVHRHARDYVGVMIGDAEVTNAVVGKEPKKWSFKDGDVTFLEASGEKSFAHRAVNESDKPFVNYTIELKAPGSVEHDSEIEKLANGQRRHFKGYAITEGKYFAAHSWSDEHGTYDSFGNCGESGGRALVVSLSSFHVYIEKKEHPPLNLADWRWFDKQVQFCPKTYSSHGNRAVEIKKDYW